MRGVWDVFVFDGVSVVAVCGRCGEKDAMRDFRRRHCDDQRPYVHTRTYSCTYGPAEGGCREPPATSRSEDCFPLDKAKVAAVGEY